MAWETTTGSRWVGQDERGYISCAEIWHPSQFSYRLCSCMRGKYCVRDLARRRYAAIRPVRRRHRAVLARLHRVYVCITSQERNGGVKAYYQRRQSTEALPTLPQSVSRLAVPFQPEK